MSERSYLPGLTPRRHSLMTTPPPLPGEMTELDQTIIGPPVQVRIPVRHVSETKAALHKLMQTLRECIVILDHPDAVGGDRSALFVVRTRIKVVAQDISKVKRLRI